jgi:hypothetical protein
VLQRHSLNRKPMVCAYKHCEIQITKLVQWTFSEMEC